MKYQVPTTIHYCWFGRNEKPALAKKCFKSWHKYCPNYTIVEWNEDNYDISSAPLYVQQAYAAQKWAFVADYVRLEVVYKYGGIYLDTDVELVKSFDHLLTYQAFFGFEGKEYINTGLGFGSVAKSPILKDLMKSYEQIPFIDENGVTDLTPCPVRNTAVFVEKGLECNGSIQFLKDEVLILPAEYFCPIDNATRILKKTKNTISIHHFDASWQSPQERKEHDILAYERRKQLRKDKLCYYVSNCLRRLLGETVYKKLKVWLKR